MELYQAGRRDARIILAVLTGVLALALLASNAQVRRVEAQNRQLLLQNDSLLSANLSLQSALTDSVRLATHSGAQ